MDLLMPWLKGQDTRQLLKTQGARDINHSFVDMWTASATKATGDWWYYGCSRTANHFYTAISKTRKMNRIADARARQRRADRDRANDQHVKEKMRNAMGWGLPSGWRYLDRS